MNSLHSISRRWWYLHEGGNATRWRRFLRKSVLPRHDVNVKRYQLAGLLFWSFEYCWVLLEHCWVLLRSFGPPFQLSPGQINKWSVWSWNLILVWISCKLQHNVSYKSYVTSLKLEIALGPKLFPSMYSISIACLLFIRNETCSILNSKASHWHWSWSFS